MIALKKLNVELERCKADFEELSHEVGQLWLGSLSSEQKLRELRALASRMRAASERAEARVHAILRGTSTHLH